MNKNNFKEIIESINYFDTNNFNFAYYHCDFNLILVKSLGDGFFTTIISSCIGFQRIAHNFYIYLQNSDKLIKENQAAVILINPKLIQISNNKRAIFDKDSSLYISDSIIYIKQLIFEQLKIEVDKKLNEIAALYNKYNINKL